MLVRGIMTKNVVTVSPHTTVGEAQRIMKEHGFRRLPVVDNGKLVGLVTEGRLEQIKPSVSATPLLWQITNLISHTTVGDVMRKTVVTVKPTDTAEYAVAKAQANKVGTLVVVDEGKIVGVCTTNDFFYKIVNPTLGLGESGTRFLIMDAGTGPSAEKIIAAVNRLGVAIKIIWTSPSSTTAGRDLTLHLDTEDAKEVIAAIEKLGWKVYPRQRYETKPD